MDEREALMWLCLCPQLLPHHRRSLLRAHKTARRAVAYLQGQGKGGPCYERMQRALNSDWIDWHDPNYPARLRHLTDPPEILFYRGDLRPLNSETPAVTVIGTRRATTQGRYLASRFAGALSQAGAHIVSGFARGIDSAAHWASLEVAHPYPVAVLACGLDICYPSENLPLLRQIESTGVVLSEYPPGALAMGYHFQARNRILAALAQAVLVVEAPQRSGVMLTVGHALGLGRDVFTLPGAVDHPNYQGNLNLLQEGAQLARCPNDILSQLKGPLRRDLDFPIEGPARAEQWCQRLGLPLPETLAQLSRWERTGQMRRDQVGYFRWSGPGAGVGVAAGSTGAGGATTGGSPLGSKGKFSN